jgi:hypothetical protein
MLKCAFSILLSKFTATTWVVTVAFSYIRMEKKLWIAKSGKRAVLDRLLTLEGYWSAPPSEHEDSGSEAAVDCSASSDGRQQNLSNDSSGSNQSPGKRVQNVTEMAISGGETALDPMPDNQIYPQ